MREEEGGGGEEAKEGSKEGGGEAVRREEEGGGRRRGEGGRREGGRGGGGEGGRGGGGEGGRGGGNEESKEGIKEGGEEGGKCTDLVLYYGGIIVHEHLLNGHCRHLQKRREKQRSEVTERGVEATLLWCVLFPLLYLCQEDSPDGVGNGRVHSDHVKLHLLLAPAHHLHLEAFLEALQVPAVLYAGVVAGETGAARLRRRATRRYLASYLPRLQRVART